MGDVNSSTSTSGFYLNQGVNLVIHSNSIFMGGTGTATEGIYSTGGSEKELYSNNIHTDGPGYGIYASSGISFSDYNNLYVPNGSVGYSGGAQSTLLDWQTATGWDLSGYSVNPLF